MRGCITDWGGNLRSAEDHGGYAFDTVTRYVAVMKGSIPAIQPHSLCSTTNIV